MADIDVEFLDFDKENELREEIYVSKKRSYQNTDFNSDEKDQRIKRIAQDLPSSLIEETEDVSTQRLLTKRPTDVFQDFIRISSLNGNMFYALYDDDSERDEIVDSHSILSTSNLLNSTSLPFSYDEYLSTSLDDIKMMVEELEKQEKFHEELIKNIRNKKSTGSENNNDYLLVDKYSPKSFIDLLSDEKVNRSVFEWIKEWDPLVFNKGKDKSKKKPPEKRILLLSGPPGIGKTTLARIIAKSAGYDPIECNASDDRTGSRFLLKVKDVVENDSLLISDHKPKCLIIDEIDGTYHSEGKGAIDVLLSMIDESKNKNNKNRTLKRPIICICNDLYAPTLNRLRDKSLIFKLNPPDITTLMTRIQSICKKENIKIDHRAIQVLCEMNNCDIRSCLNTLQFLSANNKIITVDSFSKSSTFGQKDMTENIYDIWKAIFYNPQNSNDTPLAGSKSKTLKKRQVDRFFSMVKSDQADLIMDGVFENMLSLKYHDHLLNKTIDSLEWFQFYDIIKKNISAYQNFELISFIPSAIAGIHSNIRTDFMGTYIQYPRKGKIAKNVKKRMKSIVKSVYKHSEIFVRVFNNEKVFIKDLCSYLIDIITPSFRPVSVHLRDKNEEIKIGRIVELFLTYGLTFEESKNGKVKDYPDEDKGRFKYGGNEYNYNIQHIFYNKHFNPNQPNNTSSNDHTMHQYQLKPSIHLLIHFPDREAILAFDKSTDSQRQIVLYQLKLLKKNKLKKDIVDNEIKLSDFNDSTLDDLMILEAEKVERDISMMVKRDFFGRIIEKKVDQNLSESVEKEKVDLYYKYHEGKTDAVRRKVYIKSLL